MIPENKWQWYGFPLHFICGARCRFHMGTKIGKYVISSVGDYFVKPDDEKPTEIGYNRLYETYVFKYAGPKKCGCCPEIKPSEIDSASYNDPKEARKGHMKMCRKWAAKQQEGRRQ